MTSRWSRSDAVRTQTRLSLLTGCAGAVSEGASESSNSVLPRIPCMGVDADESPSCVHTSYVFIVCVLFCGNVSLQQVEI